MILHESLCKLLNILIRAALSRQLGRGQAAQALGRSRGGFSSKIHVGADALGLPVHLLLTAGEAHEAPQAKALLQGFTVEQVLGDKAYDADEFLLKVDAMGAEAVIPPRSNRLKPRDYDQELYKERHLVECFISKIKQFRRVFSRSNKLARNYLAFLYFASTLIWLR